VTARTPRSPRSGPGKKDPAWLEALEHVVLLASVVLILSLVYLLFVLLSGGLAAPMIGGSQFEAMQRNVDIARRIFLYSLWIVVIAAMVRHYRVESVGYLTVLVGASCWVVLPLVVKSRVPESSASELLELGQSLIQSSQLTGGALVILGFVRVLVGRVILLSSVPAGGAGTSRAAQVQAEEAKEATGRHSLMRNCWELQFCRPSLRVSCPRYRERKSCWTKRSGCYCDQGLATRLLSSMGSKARVQAAEEMEAVQARTHREGQGAGRPRQQRAKSPCGQCPLYLEHQQHKYRVLAWLTYPAAAVVVGLTASKIRLAYEWVETTLAGALGTLQVLPHALTDQPLQGLQWLSAENAMIVIIGLILVSLFLHLTEVAVFRFKW
jgi:hypothetical protein